MPSKSRGGLSKREFAAQKLGGALNYKTGSVTVRKSAPRSTSISSGNNLKDGEYGSYYVVGGKRYETKPTGGLTGNFGDYLNNLTSGGNQILQTIAPNYSSNNSSSNKSSSSGSSNRAKASQSYNGGSSLGSVARGLLGIPTANAADRPMATPTAHNTSWLGDIVGALGNAALGPVGGIYKAVTGGAPDLGVTEKLGLSKDLPVQEFGIGENLTPSQQEQAMFTINNPGGGVTDAINPENNLPRQQAQPTPAPYLNWNTFNETQGNPSNNRNDTRINRPLPQPNQSTNISGSYAPQPNQYPSNQDYYSNQQDNTPISPENGTVRQLLGNGYLSSGQYGNGSGLTDNVNMGLGGGNNNWIQDQINNVLGINTAQASDIPQSAMSLIAPNYNSNQSVSGGNGTGNFMQSYLNGLIPNQGMAQDIYKQYFGQTPAATKRDTSSSRTTQSSAQSFNQAAPDNYQQQLQNSLKGYGSQEKAQKKALKELLKSIEGQYKQATTEGKQTLEKSKVDDLQKLNSMFSFANSDPNDEQRIQYNQRTQNDYAGQLTTLLNKLSQGKAQDISAGKQNYYDKIGAIEQARQSAQLNVAKLLQDYKQQQIQNQLASRKASNNGVTGWQYAYDNNGNVTGTYAHDENGNTFYNPIDTPFQGKSKTQNPLEQLFQSFN